MIFGWFLAYICFLSGLAVRGVSGGRSRSARGRRGKGRSGSRCWGSHCATRIRIWRTPKGWGWVLGTRLWWDNWILSSLETHRTYKVSFSSLCHFWRPWRLFWGLLSSELCVFYGLLAPTRRIGGWGLCSFYLPDFDFLAVVLCLNIRISILGL